jgi:hypothetical protein
MTQYRVPKKTSKYYVPEQVYLTVVHFCRQYPLWKAELEINPNTQKAIDYSRDVVQTSNQFDQTSEIAMDRKMIADKKELVEKTAHEVAGVLAEWLLLGVGHGLTYYQLVDKGIPCGKDMYYDIRRKFYFVLSKRI